MACGCPVVLELRITTAEARSIPTPMLAGNDDTHLIPAISCPLLTYAGNAMIRLAGSSGNVRNCE